jgi:putative FmdB family regulatory protein
VPTYQYSCTDCGHFFEVVQSFSDDSLTVCPDCEGRLRKVFNAVGVVFKGSGFYRTDSRSEGQKSAVREGSGDGTTKDAPKKDAAKSDSSGTGSGNGASNGSGSGKGSGAGKGESSSTSTPSPAA